MQDKDFDNLLRESVNKEPVRDFSEVWSEIKDQLEPKKKEKKFSWKKWFPVALTSVAVIVCIVLLPFLIKQPELPQEEIFYADVLQTQMVELSPFLDGLSELNVSNITTERYQITETKLCFTEDNKLKGACFTIYSESPIPIFAKVNLYSKDVDAGVDLENGYDTTCQVKSASVHYKFKQEDDGMYMYDIYILNKDIQYVMEYIGLSEDLSEFLDYFID
ncbi:MAG: hypothetical protein E7348_05675 [Clostridiales bacterium]|nr:hypothetical protein [Clostridiales bacterium]